MKRKYRIKSLLQFVAAFVDEENLKFMVDLVSQSISRIYAPEEDREWINAWFAGDLQSAISVRQLIKYVIEMIDENAKEEAPYESEVDLGSYDII